MSQEDQLIAAVIGIVLLVSAAVFVVSLLVGTSHPAQQGDKIVFRRPKVRKSGDPHRAKRELAEEAFARRVQGAVDDLDLARLDALEAEIHTFFRDLYAGPYVEGGERLAEKWSQAIFAVRQPMVAQRELKGIPAGERHRQEREEAYRDLILAVTLRDETRAHHARFRLLAAAEAVGSEDARKEYEDLSSRVINYLREMAEEQLEADIGRARTDDELRKRETEFRQDVTKAAAEAEIELRKKDAERRQERWKSVVEATNELRKAIVASQAELRANPSLEPTLGAVQKHFEILVKALEQAQPERELDEEELGKMFDSMVRQSFQRVTGMKLD